MLRESLGKSRATRGKTRGKFLFRRGKSRLERSSTGVNVVTISASRLEQSVSGKKIPNFLQENLFIYTNATILIFLKASKKKFK